MFTLRLYRRLLLIGMLFISLQLMIFSIYQLNVKDIIFPSFNFTSYPMPVNVMAVVEAIHNNWPVKIQPLYGKYENYSISNAAICFPQDIRNDLIIAIKSSLHNRQRRNIIRDTWADEYCWKSFKIKRIFFIEGSDNLTVSASIYSEFMEHGDIVQFEEFDDGPALKSYVAFQWLRENCLNTDYILISDESIDIKPNNVIRYLLKQKNSESRLYAGEFISPERLKVRYGSSLSYGIINYWELYSPYIQTNLMILSANVLEEIAIAMQYTKLFHINEIYLAIIVAKLDIYTTTDFNVDFRDSIHKDYENRDNEPFLRIESCKPPLTKIPLLPSKASKYPYPLNVNMNILLKALEDNKRIDIKPINQPNFQYSIRNDGKCKPLNKSLDLLLVIKSRADDFMLRTAIRETWGNENCWNDWTVRRIFPVGLDNNDNNHKVSHEAKIHNDIIRQNFLDRYHNNTYKTMMSLDWIHKNCPNAKLVILVDADVYLQAKNIKKYITNLNPARKTNLYSGLRLPSSALYRSPRSKWYVSKEEIPWKRYPPFIMGGAVFMTYSNIKKMAMIMPYMRYFKIDDAFLGLMAHKLGIQSTGMPYIHLVSFGKINNYFLAQHFFKPNKIRTYWKQLGADKFCHK